jgi:hypothetical protein
MREGADKLDKRVTVIESRSAWLTGVLAVIGAIAGWYAKAFTVTTGGK